MMSPFQRLLGLKESKQLNALKTLQAKRGEVLRARQVHQLAEQAVQQNAAGYGRRVDALYAPILGKTIDLTHIEEIENRIAQLDVDHEALIEAEHDALDQLEELEEAQSLLSSAYALAVRSCDKFRTLNNIVEGQAREVAERLEELELEEGFRHHRETLT